VAENKKSSINTKSTCHLLNIKQPDRVANRLKFSFQRTSALISVLKLNKNVQASISMVDISEAGAGVFCSELLLKGSTVELCLTEPRILKVKCLVAWSVPVQSGIHNKRYPFRAGLQFVFQNEIQRTALLEFIKKINTDPLENMKSSHVMESPISNADPVVAEASVAPPVATEGAPPVAADPNAPPTESGAAPDSTAAAGESPVAANPTPTESTPAEPVAAAEPTASVTETPATPPSEGDGSGSQAA
jgi:hypothetical protein